MHNSMHHTAPQPPARPAPPASIPTAADARAARGRLRDARREGDAAEIAACLAVIEAHETGRPLRAVPSFHADAR